jgi:hypothetical protein
MYEKALACGDPFELKLYGWLCEQVKPRGVFMAAPMAMMGCRNKGNREIYTGYTGREMLSSQISLLL